MPRDSLEEARHWLNRVGQALRAIGPVLSRVGRSARAFVLARLSPLAATALRRGTGLSAKLLLLTILFVMLAEVLIFVPSIANFRINWLNDRLVAAKLAALAAEAVPDGVVPEPLRMELLLTAQVRSVAWKRGNERRLVLPPAAPLEVDASYDFRASAHAPGLFNEFVLRLRLIWEAIAVFFDKKNQVILVLGEPGMRSGDFIEVVLPEAPLKAAMIRYGLNIFGLSVIISIITAALVYFTLNSLLVKPMMRITRNMLAFSRNPEDTSRIIEPTSRTDEIGTAERELAHMQLELTQTLQQKSRLAALGLAVSKINHDLRNMLASAQLISDRLAHLPDPAVQTFAPKLIASLDRAIDLCNTTLRFGRAEEAPPRRELIQLHGLVAEVGDSLGLPREGAIDWSIEIDLALRIDADRDQLFRVLSNLGRNALQAIEQHDGVASPGRICVTAERHGARVEIDVSDSGPGVPPKAREHLFQAFQGAARKGGTGLGLAIAHELIAAHGGTIRLRETPTGATFVIEIPDRGARERALG